MGENEKEEWEDGERQRERELNGMKDIQEDMK